MGHCVTAIIGSPLVVDRLLDGRSLVAADLRDGFRLVPLDDDALDTFGFDFSQTIDGFNYLCPGFRDFLTGLSHHGPLAYVETEYFGGMGSQAAAAFSAGHVLPPSPLSGDGSINTALRSIGIASTTGDDEFDYIGLSQHRHTSDWMEAATERAHR